MTDRRYRVTNQEEMFLGGNANNSEVRVLDDKRSHRKFSKTITIILVIFLVLVCIVLAVLLAVEKIRQNESQSTYIEHTEKEQTRVCTTAECVRASSDILRNVDRGVDPCDDFFLHACGGWIQNNPIPPNEPLWNQVLILKTRNDQLLKTLLDDAKVRDQYKENEAVQKAFLYYDSCVNYGLIEQAAARPLLTVIASYGSWNITDANWTENGWSFKEALVGIHRNLRLSPFFKLEVQPDLRDSSRYIIMLDQTSHAITRDAYLGNSSYHLAVRGAYQKLMTYIVKLLGGDETSSPFLREIFQLEENLAQISATAGDRADRSEIYRLMSIKELQQHTRGKINWLYFLKGMFADLHYNITENEPVAVFALEYFTKMSDLTSQTSSRILANYMMWQAIVHLAPYLSDQFRQAFNSFQEIVMGSTGETNVWQKCITEMSQYDNELGDPLGVVFLDNKFDKRDKESVVAMINDLRATFITNLDSLDWMDEETKSYAKEKAMAIRQNIGYPEYLNDSKKLTEIFKDVSSGSYFWNVVNNRAFNMKRMLRDLRKPVDKGRWMIHPHTVNAFYDRVTNKIIFPAGILQIPFYNRNFPRAISFGGIGIVVAHEITHGFDSNGRKYDKNGDLVNWWTNSSNLAFENKSQCFVDQYSNYETYGTKLNGLQTLGENIADNGAIKQGFMAYQTWVRKNGQEAQLPGLNYTNEQLFFIAAAQVDCGSTLKPIALKKIEQGSHSLEQWRVVGEMSNSKEFAKAFNCPVGSRMNREKKCSIW